MSAKSDVSGQQWRDIKEAIGTQQNDIIIVGRGVTGSADPAAEIRKYKEAGWSCLTAL